MTVTPNPLPATGAISRADLNALGNPDVAYDAADVTAIAAELSASAAGINYLANSDFRTWPQTSISLPATWTLTASGWYAKGTYSPSASTGMTVQRSTDAVHDHVIYCASITGEPNGTIATIGQRFTSSVAAAWLEEGATLQIEVENKTGANQTATLVWDTCDVLDDFSATTQQTTVSLGTVLANERKVLPVTLDLTSFKTATRRGGILSVQLPGLNSGSKEWRVYYSRLEPGQNASPRRIERDAVTTASTTTADAVNYFENSAFVNWLITGSSSPATELLNNYFCERWGVTPGAGGSTCIVTRVASAPDTRSRYALQIAGDTTATSQTDFHQYIYAATAANLQADTLNVSWWVYNNTGASFTPQLRIDTSGAANNQTFTNRLAQNMQSCASGAWTQVTLSFTPSSLTNWANGARITLRAPAGTLDSGAKSIRIAQAQLVRGTTVATFWEPPRQPAPNASTARTTAGLAIVRDSTTTCTVAISDAVCVSRDGAAVTVGAMSATSVSHADTLTTNQHYHIRLMCDESGRVTPFSHLWNTNPHTITAISMEAFISGVIGVFTTNGSSQIDDFSQRGHNVCTLAAVMQSTGAAANNTYQQIPVFGGFDKIPAIVTAIRGTFGTSSGVLRGALAASSSGLGAMDFGAGTSTSGVDSFTTGAMPFYLPLVTAQTAYFKMELTTQTPRIVCTGYDLP